MPFERQLAVGALDFVGRGFLVYAKDLVVISFVCHILCSYNYFCIAENLSTQGVSGLNYVNHFALELL